MHRLWSRFTTSTTGAPTSLTSLTWGLLFQVADLHRGCPAPPVRKVGMGGNQPYSQVRVPFNGLSRCTFRRMSRVSGHTVLQISSSFLAPWLLPVCGQHLCWFQGPITHGASWRLIHLYMLFLMPKSQVSPPLAVQEIPFFFTLQNSSHVVSYVILKAAYGEVSAATHSKSHRCLRLWLMPPSHQQKLQWLKLLRYVPLLLPPCKTRGTNQVLLPFSLCFMLLSAINLPFYDPQVT